MSCRILLVLAVIAAVVAGCGGGDEARPTSSPSATAVTRTPWPSPTCATATPSPSAAAVPRKPAAFDEYADTVARYLEAAGPSALGADCLRELIEAWEMPTQAERWPCSVGNADGDKDEEVALVLSTPDPTQSGVLLQQVVVFDPLDGGYAVAYASETLRSPEAAPAFAELLALSDINGDGAGELVYTDTDCGAHTCTSTAHILTGASGGFRSLTGEGVSMASASVSLTDDNGDGVFDLVMKGGPIGSVGAGPQRERTEVYSWDGSAYALASVTYAPTDVLYLRILDADAAFAAERYGDALAAYEEALNDRRFSLWKEEAGIVDDERAELDPYILFRIALCRLALGAPAPEALSLLDRAVAEYPSSEHAGLAASFRDSLLARGDLSIACAAARDYATAHIDAFTAIWDYGYANPSFDVAAVCPF